MGWQSLQASFQSNDQSWLQAAVGTSSVAAADGVLGGKPGKGAWPNRMAKVRCHLCVCMWEREKGFIKNSGELCLDRVRRSYCVKGFRNRNLIQCKVLSEYQPPLQPQLLVYSLALVKRKIGNLCWIHFYSFHQQNGRHMKPWDAFALSLGYLGDSHGQCCPKTGLTFCLLSSTPPRPQLSSLHLECILKLCINLDSSLPKEYPSMALMPSSEVWRLMVPWGSRQFQDIKALVSV